MIKQNHTLHLLNCCLKSKHIMSKHGINQKRYSYKYVHTHYTQTMHISPNFEKKVKSYDL